MKHNLKIIVNIIIVVERKNQLIILIHKYIRFCLSAADVTGIRVLLLCYPCYSCGIILLPWESKYHSTPVENGNKSRGKMGIKVEFNSSVTRSKILLKKEEVGEK
jgi:hypothetical protein